MKECRQRGEIRKRTVSVFRWCIIQETEKRCVKFVVHNPVFESEQGGGRSLGASTPARLFIHQINRCSEAIGPGNLGEESKCRIPDATHTA